MMIFKVFLILATISTCCYAVVNIKKELKRREASPGYSYGAPPPKLNTGHPLPIYGAPGPVAKYPPPPPDIPPQLPQKEYGVPHREYGVPQQQLPHREYGVPILKYGPPKINLEYGAPLFKNVPQKLNGGGLFSAAQSSKTSLYEQIKSHFGVPKPAYGPPHSASQRPNAFIIKNNFGTQLQGYGLPQPQKSYGPPPLPQSSYGPPQLPSSSKPISSYGPPPQSSYGPPPQSSYGPPPHPSPSYGPPPKPGHSYGPPPPPNPSYGPPPSSGPKPIHLYGPPPQSSYGPPPQIQLPSTSYGVPQISSNAFGAASNLQNNVAQLGPKEVHIFDSHHQSSGSGGHIATVSCDGWKPIPGPVGYNAEHNNVHSSFGGLSDDQLIAVALQANFGGAEQEQNLPESSHNVDFHSTYSNNDLNAFKNQEFEFSQNGIGDSYSSPPQDSYAPSSIHSSKYNGNFKDESQQIGLIPPSGVYGVPPGDSYINSAIHHGPGNHGGSSSQGLGIQYGSVSGNLKPWLGNGQPPKRPVAFRPPVPSGFLESIGASVQHLDTFGVKPNNEPGTYIPPPSAEVAQHLADEQQLSPYASENIAYAQVLPSGQEPRFNQAQDCGHGPNLNGGNFDQNNYNSFDVSSNYVTSNQGTSNYQGSSNYIGQNDHDSSNYIISNDQGSSGHQQNILVKGGEGLSTAYIAAALTASDSYGPPPSGNPSDISGYESKHSATYATSQSSSSSSSENEEKSEDLPGLNDLNVISAQKSQSVTIPVQGQHGTYQLQFQPADPLSSPLNTGEQANHEQILSEGLLQSILTAIEQPNAGGNAPQVNEIESRVDHKDADQFLNSPEGKKTLSEPNDTKS